LDKALFGRDNCTNRYETSADITDKYINLWGGVAGGLAEISVSFTDSAYYWSTSPTNPDAAWCMKFNSDAGNIASQFAYSQRVGMQVRCVR
jgi:hypothetical protein